MDALRTENLTKIFKRFTAVDRLTLSVPAGGIFGLVGPDGAGKTTVMRLLAAVMIPTAGEAWVLGHHSVREAERIKERIGYMSQRFGLYEDLTVIENINFYSDIYGVTAGRRRETVRELLSFSGLEAFQKRRAGDLSGGMKQKLGLACALVHRPALLLLDEPTNGVDPVSRRDFWRILYRLLAEGVTIVVSTAYLDEAERCGRIGLMHKGRLLATGTPADVKRLMKETILEVRATVPRRAAAVLKDAMGSEAVSLFGDKVHVATDVPGKDTEMVAELLRKERIEVGDIRPVEPELEDVFVSVLAKDRENGIHG
ncbi:MAG TPA: ABC transporter ATP-binding protein [Deltaproteobacteria bacterium]|nr:ABC transporter ATP-binding protein [Deltaproteobacteria bacterium]